LTPEVQQRLAELADEVRSLLYGEAGCPAWGTLFTEIEDDAKEVGHEFIRLLMQQSVSDQADTLVPEVLTTDSGELARSIGSEERTVETESGGVSWNEPKAYLPKSRKAVVFEAAHVESRDVMASLTGSVHFGKQLAARAWALGFAAAPVKAFIADGQAANWGIWKRHFKHLKFVPILDFIHALTYVYAAAMAGRTKEEGAPVYLRWITWVWQGQVSQVIAELATRAAELGPPPADVGETDPRQIIAETLTYFINQQSRMNYPDYRRQGLPITSSHIESTVKQINQRVKGSEKFWTAEGGEALLQLRADQLSDTQPLTFYWLRRSRNATGTRTYTKAA